jgi:hypothetical protein
VHSPGMFAGVRVYHFGAANSFLRLSPKGRSRAHLIVLLSYMGIMLAEVHRREPVEILVFLAGAIAVGILARRWGLALALGAAAAPVVAACLYLEWRGSTRQTLVSDSPSSVGQRPFELYEAGHRLRFLAGSGQPPFRNGAAIGLEAAETGFRARMACNPRQPASGGLDEIPCERPF